MLRLTAKLLPIVPFLLTALLAGCDVGFEVADDDKAETERIHHEPPPIPLETARYDEVAPINTAYGNDVSSITAVFDHTATEPHDLRLDITSLIAKDCPDEESTKFDFTWRTLDEEGTIVTEVDVLPTDKFAVGAGSHALAVKLKTSIGRCRIMSLSFKAQTFPR